MIGGCEVEPLATVKELQSQFRIMDPSELEAAEPRLEDATSRILSYMRSIGAEVDETDEVQAQLLKSICIEMVARSMVVSTNEVDIQAWGGSTVYTAKGNLYLTTQDKDMLRAYAPPQKVGFMMPSFGGGLDG